MKEEVFITKNAEETQRLGQSFAEKMKEGDVVALYGDLGGGKTTFVQGLARGFGINRVTSPTFNIIKQYKIKYQKSNIKNTKQRLKLFYHIDLYRINLTGDIKSLGIEELFDNPHTIIVIEWAEKMGDLLPKKRIDIRFEYLGEDKRKITVKNNL